MEENMHAHTLSRQQTHVSDSDILEWGRKTLHIEREGLESLERRLDESFVQAVRAILTCEGRVFFTGLGKSGIIARKIASSFASISVHAFFLHPVEAMHGDLGVLVERDCVFILSYSGETSEVLRFVEWLHRWGVKIISITGHPGSTLAQYSDIVLDCSVPAEASPGGALPTTSTTVSLALGDALVVAVMRALGLHDELFARTHPNGKIGKRFVRVDQCMHKGEQLPICSLDTPIEDTLDIITQKRFGCGLIVDENGKLCGIITDGDIRRALKNIKTGQVRYARELMTEHPRTVKNDMLMADAVHLMEKFRIMYLPVVDEKNKPVGLLYIHDIWKWL